MYDQTALLADLETSLATRTGDWRASALRQMTALCLAGGKRLAPEHVALYDLILPRMIDTVDQRTLAEIAAMLARSPAAPPLTLEMLARNRSMAVAGPILEAAPSLTDALLMDVAATGERDALLILARRGAISPQVSDALLERQDAAVSLALFSNPGASISEMGYVQMIDAAKADEKLLHAICSRSDIPAELKPFFEMAARPAN